MCLAANQRLWKQLRTARKSVGLNDVKYTEPCTKGLLQRAMVMGDVSFQGCVKGLHLSNAGILNANMLKV